MHPVELALSTKQHHQHQQQRISSSHCISPSDAATLQFLLAAVEHAGIVCSAAKAYLQRVRALDAAQRSSDEGEDDEGGDRHAQLSERLRREALEVTG